MVTSVSSSSSSTPTPAATQTTAAKPWAWGDPSSFAQLFSPTAPPASTATTAKSAPAATSVTTPTASTVATAPAATPAPAAVTAATPKPADVSSPSPAAPFTFEQGATVSGYNTSTQLNSQELATADTADRIAAMLGGTVKAEPTSPDGGFAWSVPTRDIVFSGSNVTINAGIAAYLFNTYGTAPGSAAWQSLNQTLGRDPMSTTPVVS